MALKPSSSHNSSIRSVESHNELFDGLQLNMQNDFIDVMAMFGLREPLKPDDLSNMFRPLVKKVYKKIDAEWQSKYRSINREIFDRFWKQQFENHQQIMGNCSKWIISLKETVPNGLFSAIQCLLSFNRDIVEFVTNNLRQLAADFKNSYLTRLQALNLRVSDLIDHQYSDGLYKLAEIVVKNGRYLKIHYHGWANKYDVWSDYDKELQRFAHPRSISGRARHRLQHLKIGDLISIFYENVKTFRIF